MGGFGGPGPKGGGRQKGEDKALADKGGAGATGGGGRNEPKSRHADLASKRGQC